MGAKSIMDNKIIYLIIGIIILLAIAFGTQNWGFFSVIGACNSDNVIVTNVNPLTLAYTSYGNTAAWISADINNDGIKEKFGKYSTSTSTASASTTLEIISSTNHIKTDGTYLYVTSSGAGYTKFKQDYGAASNALTSCGGCTPNCVGKCGGVSDGCGGSCTQSCGSCTSNWQCSSWSTCSSGTQSRTCNDLNSCGTANPNPLTQSCSSGGTCTPGQRQCVTGYTNRYQECLSGGSWSGSLYCSSGQTCSNGLCLSPCTSNWVCNAWSACSGSQQTRTCYDSASCNPSNPSNPNPLTQSCTMSCNTQSDTNCDGAVSRDELGVTINQWISSSISRTTLGEAIQAWTGG